MRIRLRLRRAALALCFFLLLALWWAVSARPQTAPSPAQTNPAPTEASARNGAAPISRRPAGAPNPMPPPSAVLGTISGRVTRDGGLPAVGFTVRAVPAGLPRLRYSKSSQNTAVTGADGRYTLTLHPPTFSSYSGPMNRGAKGYLVWVVNGGQPYVEPPPLTVDTAALPGHAASGADFVLRLGPQMTVHAHDAITGAPVPGLTIRYGSSLGVNQDAGVTGSDGTLRFRVPFTDIRLEAQVPDAERATMQAAPGYGAGDRFFRQVKARPGEEVDWEIKTYGPTRESDWRGVVLGPDGRPAGGVPVRMMRQGGGASLTTDAQGRFSARLPRLEYGESSEWDKYNLPAVYARRGDLAAYQVITPDASWGGMTLRLARGAALAGTLTDPRGRPAADVNVSFPGSRDGQDLFPSAITDRRGRFTLDGLPPGSYQIRAHGGGFADSTFPPPDAGPHTPQTYLRLAAGQRRDVGRLVVVRADRILTGGVVDDRGKPVSGLFIRVTGAHSYGRATTQEDGAFRVYDLADEPLTVEVGLPGRQVTATVPPGQADVRLTAPPDVVAADGRGVPAQPRSTPAGSPTVYPHGASAPLNRLALAVLPADGGAFTAAILRPNSLQPFPPFFGSLLDGSVPTLWRGALSDMDGMRLTVRRGQGTLTDRTGRSLWAGVVQDPPDYVVTWRGLDGGGQKVTVRDRRGKTLWSGPAVNGSGGVVRDGEIRMIGPGQTVVYRRAVADARVAVSQVLTDAPPRLETNPADGTLTLHVVSATATLRSPEGQVLWSGTTPVVTVDVAGFPPEPRPSSRPGQTGVAHMEWMWQRRLLLPPPVLSFLSARDAPPGSVLTFMDGAGRPLPGGVIRFG